MAKVLRRRLQTQRQFGCPKTVLACCRIFGAVLDIPHKLSAKHQLILRAIDVAHFLVVDQNQMIAAFTSSKVAVLSHFDCAFGSHDKQSSITKRRYRVGREPVYAKVAANFAVSILASQHGVSKILK